MGCLWDFATNLDIKNDPDFGDSSSANGNKLFKVIVESKIINKDWYFYLILPDGDEAETEVLAHQACRCVLATEYYTVCQPCEADIKEYTNAIPVLMYDPTNVKEFTWTVPPKAIRH